MGQATDMQLPVRHLDATQVLDFVHHLLFKNTKTELSIDPLELIIAYLFDELNWVNTSPPFYPVTETDTISEKLSSIFVLLGIGY